MFKKTASPAAHAGYKKKWSVLVIVIIIQNLLVRSAGTARGWLQRARCFFSLPKVSSSAQRSQVVSLSGRMHTPRGKTAES
jgi:hypothetical protein